MRSRPPSGIVEHSGIREGHSTYTLLPGAARHPVFGRVYNTLRESTPAGTMISRASAREAIESGGARGHYALKEGKITGAATSISIPLGGRTSQLHIGYLTPGSRPASEALIQAAVRAHNQQNGAGSARFLTAEAGNQREAQHLENLGFRFLGTHQQGEVEGLQARAVSVWARGMRTNKPLGNSGVRQTLLNQVRQALYG